MIPEDSELVRDVQAGDTASFAPLVRRHQPRILGLCLALLGNRPDAEEATQEAFLKAFRSLSGFRRDSSFFTWLYRIARNHCLEVLRRRGRRREDPLDPVGGDLHEKGSEANPASPALEPIDLARRALAALREDQQTILILREVNGLTYREIADALRISLDNVKIKLFRARQALLRAGCNIPPAAGV